MSKRQMTFFETRADGALTIPVDASAVFSEDRQYRYLLTREWDDSRPLCAFCLLNPSVADATLDDPTTIRCFGFARALGCGSLWIVNISDYCATDFRKCLDADFPESPENRNYIEMAVKRAVDHRIICGWGNGGVNRGRGDEIKRFIQEKGGTTMCLRLTELGQPAHPLYLPGYLKPKVWP